MAILPQRPLRGSRISSFYPVKSLPSLASLDSAFQLQEYISLLIRLDVHDVDSIVTLPGKRAGKEKEVDESEKNEAGDERDDTEEKKNEVTVDEACWIYEQLRRLAQDLTHPLITMLQQECTRASCPEMKAGEWLYLCVAHGTDGNVEQCCAIDYILHTLDSATALLNTPRAFPSRLQIPPSSHRHFSSLARRLGRIFAHAYFHHREAFEQAEAESSLYARFLALTSKFDLVPTEFLVIPTHSGSGSDSDSDREGETHIPRLLAAAVEPQALEQQEHGQGQGSMHWERRGSVIPIEPRAKSNSPPGLNNGGGSESPRKMGRNRTDTMVLHDGYAVAEELAKASPKVPSLDAFDEPMSPVDVEELPRTAKPAAEPQEEEIGSSLPESPTLNSPSPSAAPTLPAEAQKEKEEPEKKQAVVDAPVLVPKASPAPEEHAPPPTAEPLSPPVEADIAETALASADVKIASDAMQVQGTSEVFEEPKQEVQEEAKEEELRVEASAEEVKEVADANVEEASEDAPVPEVASKEATLEAQEVAVEASAPAPAPEPVIESVSEITESAPAATTTVEETVAALVDASVELETVVQIPDEAKVVSVTEEKTDAVAELVTKAGAEAEAEARARAEADEEREVEAIAMPVAEEQREEVKQEDKTPELAKEATPVPSS